MKRYSFVVTETVTKLVYFDAVSLEDAELLLEREPDVEAFPNVEVVETGFSEARDWLGEVE